MTDPSKSTKIKVRVRTEDSAFVYGILEASGGVCAYSTLAHQIGDRHRDLELIVPQGQAPEVDRILADLQIQLSGELYVITSESAPKDSD